MLIGSLSDSLLWLYNNAADMEEGSISEVIWWYTDKEEVQNYLEFAFDIEAPQGVLLMDEVTR